MVAASDSDSLPPLSCRLSDVQGGHGRVGFLAGPGTSRDPPAGPSCLQAVQDYDTQGGGPSSGSSPENGEGDRPDDDGEGPVGAPSRRNRCSGVRRDRGRQGAKLLMK